MVWFEVGVVMAEDCSAGCDMTGDMTTELVLSCHVRSAGLTLQRVPPFIELGLSGPLPVCSGCCTDWDPDHDDDVTCCGALISIINCRQLSCIYAYCFWSVRASFGETQILNFQETQDNKWECVNGGPVSFASWGYLLTSKKRHRPIGNTWTSKVVSYVFVGSVQTGLLKLFLQIRQYQLSRFMSITCLDTILSQQCSCLPYTKYAQVMPACNWEQ